MEAEDRERKRVSEEHVMRKIQTHKTKTIQPSQTSHTTKVTATHTCKNISEEKKTHTNLKNNNMNINDKTPNKANRKKKKTFTQTNKTNR